MRCISERQLSQEIIEALDYVSRNQDESLYINYQGENFVLLREKEYQNICKKKKENLIDFFKNSPLYGIELDIQRDKTPSREVEF
ncbi:MAG: hypothetical protein HQK79_20220 [Desulfobacterales bacterium]|nr:hypothetical protein [Desulfobacterales bacterium]